MTKKRLARKPPTSPRRWKVEGKERVPRAMACGQRRRQYREKRRATHGGSGREKEESTKGDIETHLASRNKSRPDPPHRLHINLVLIPLPQRKRVRHDGPKFSSLVRAERTGRNAPCLFGVLLRVNLLLRVEGGHVGGVGEGGHGLALKGEGVGGGGEERKGRKGRKEGEAPRCE